MPKLSKAELQSYTSSPAFTVPAVSSRATRLSVPDDVWRCLEIVPGLLTWGILVLAVIFSFFAPVYVAYFILLFDVYWLMKSLSMSHSLIRAYRFLKRDTKIEWSQRLKFLDRSVDTYEIALSRAVESVTGNRKALALAWWNVRQMFVNRPLQQEYRQLRTELRNIRSAIDDDQPFIQSAEIYHLVIIATYTEELDTLRPSFAALAACEYDKSRMIVVLATEGRDADRARANAKVIKREFGSRFGKLMVTEHPPDILGETKGKGSNISWAGRQAAKEIDKMNIPADRVLVTTLDADHRPHPEYFAALTYAYMMAPERTHVTFQPTPLFHNNLWDTTAINRVIATGSSFWHMVESTRAYRLRNFAAHSQSLQAIKDTDFWSVDTIVEDGQQFWRTYFRYHGRHYVIPVYVPVYQDAVLGETYLKTLRAQYLQLRRWAWGSSDFPYIVINAWRDRRIPWANKLTQTVRFLEGHFTWATAPILITFVGLLPTFLSPDFRESLLGQTLAPTASIILTLALVGMVVTIFISMLLLPPKPEGYRSRRRVWMLLQWALMPVTTIVFSSLPAIESQTRLMFGKYLEFRVTEKAVGPMRRKKAEEAPARR